MNNRAADFIYIPLHIGAHRTHDKHCAEGKISLKTKISQGKMEKWKFRGMVLTSCFQFGLHIRHGDKSAVRTEKSRFSNFYCISVAGERHPKICKIEIRFDIGPLTHSLTHDSLALFRSQI